MEFPNGRDPGGIFHVGFDGEAFIPEDLHPKDPEDPRPQGCVELALSQEIRREFPGMESRENEEGLCSTPGYQWSGIKIFHVKRFQSKKTWEVSRFSFHFHLPALSPAKKIPDGFSIHPKKGSGMIRRD